MIIAPHTVFKERVNPFPWIDYNTVNVRIKDGCRICTGQGKISFSTEDDSIQWLLDPKEEDPCCGPDDPNRSGRKTCPKCQGTGQVAGSGDLVVSNLDDYLIAMLGPEHDQQELLRYRQARKP